MFKALSEGGCTPMTKIKIMASTQSIATILYFGPISHGPILVQVFPWASKPKKIGTVNDKNRKITVTETITAYHSA